jgi:hypothetical protein
MGALGVAFGNVSSTEPEQVVGPVAQQGTEQTIYDNDTSDHAGDD